MTAPTTPATASPPPLLTLTEASTYLGVPRSTLEKWTRAGRLPAIKLGGQARSHVRFRRGDLDAYVAACAAPVTTGPLATAGLPA